MRCRAEDRVAGSTLPVHSDQACIQAVIPRRRNSARPQSLALHVRNNRWPRDAVARTARSDPDGLSVDQRTRSAAFFLMTQQAAFDTSWMHLGAEAFLDQLTSSGNRNGWFFLAHLDQ